MQEVRERRKVGRQLEQWVKKLKCSGSSGIGLETFKEIRVGVDPSPVDLGRHQSFDPVKLFQFWGDLRLNFSKTNENTFLTIF